MNLSIKKYSSVFGKIKIKELCEKISDLFFVDVERMNFIWKITVSRPPPQIIGAQLGILRQKSSPFRIDHSVSPPPTYPTAVTTKL